MLVYQKDGLDLELQINRATLRAGILRGKLINFQEAIIGESDAIDEWVWRSFCECMAATEVVKGPGLKKLCQAVWRASQKELEEEKKHPLVGLFQKYLDLPEELAEIWHGEVLDLNTHWAPWRSLGASTGEAESDGLDSKAISPVASSDD